jgi:glutaredoxin-related protein
MPRLILDETRMHPAIRDRIANWHADIVHNVQAASTSNPVFVRGVLVGGHEEMKKLIDSGELKRLLGEP